MTFMEEPIVNGGGYQASAESRWGDYSMLALDPVDDETFWYINEYYQYSNDMNWMTRIATFKISTLQVDAPESHPEPEHRIINGNFPNPFSGSTVIRYRLSERCYISLKVFDLLGNEVSRLVRG